MLLLLLLLLLEHQCIYNENVSKYQIWTYDKRRENQREYLNIFRFQFVKRLFSKSICSDDLRTSITLKQFNKDHNFLINGFIWRNLCMAPRVRSNKRLHRTAPPDVFVFIRFFSFSFLYFILGTAIEKQTLMFFFHK